jgi:hypothetical protein
MTKPLTRMAAACCTHGCYMSLREDRKFGLIYGPYPLDRIPPDNIYVDAEVFATIHNQCTYCNEELPRGRQRFLLKKMQHQRRLPMKECRKCGLKYPSRSQTQLLCYPCEAKDRKKYDNRS